MSANSSESGLVAARYATAFLDMATDAKIVETVEKDLLTLQAMIAESDDLQSLVKNPLIARGQKSEAILAIAKKSKFHKLTCNFLGVLIANNRLVIVDGVINAFKTALTKSRGEVEARVQTAVALSAAQTKAIAKELSAAMGSQVTLNVEVDKDLLGGMIVTVGSRMIDNSVKRKLENLRRAMNSNEPQQKEVG